MAKLVDVTKDDKASPGACLVLTKEMLDKIGLDYNADIGDFVHFTALGRVTSVHKAEAEEHHVRYGDAEKVGDPMVRVEIELVAMGLEDESHEEMDMEPVGSNIGSKLFGGE